MEDDSSVAWVARHGALLSTGSFMPPTWFLPFGLGGRQLCSTYDRENRMILRNEASNRTTMTYNGEGQRWTRQTSTKLTTFIWDGADYIQERNP
jgi:YD repeat-containing protein